MSTRKKTKRFIIEIFIWLILKPKWFLLALSLTVFLLTLLCFTFSKENMIRVGVAFQWIGILSVFLNIRNTKKDFSKLNNIDELKKWFNDRPKYNPEIICIELDSIYVNVEFIGGKITTVAHWNDNISLEENMKVNINIINRCIDDINNLERKITNEISEISNSFHQEISEIKSLLNSLKNDIEKVATGGINLTFISSIWILIGVTISTIPDDIISILNWLSKIYNS